MRLFKPAYTTSIPENAKILHRKAGKFAQWRDRSGAQREAPLTKDGKRVRIETTCYSISFEDHLRIKRTLKAFTDKAATQRLADLVQRLVNGKRLSAPLDDELQAFVTGLDDQTRSQLIDWGLLDAEQNELARPLLELIGEYRDHLKAKDRNAKHIRETVKMVTDCFSACHFGIWRDIADVAVEGHLSNLRQGPMNLSHRGSNAILQACKSFCAWVVKRKWADASPLRSLDKLNVKEDPRHIRRALSVPDLRHFIHKTAEGPERFGMTGYERHLLYRFTIETAGRKGEIQRLCWATTVQPSSARSGRKRHRYRSQTQASHTHLR